MNFLHDHHIEDVPKPLKIDLMLSVPYYVEEGIGGGNVEKRFLEGSSAEVQNYYRQAQKKIAELHLKFGRRSRFTKAIFDEFLEERLAAIRKKVSGNEKAARGLQQIGEFLFVALQNRELLVTVSHGDFKIGNCLFDRRGNITGIIDWDMGERRELNLVDLSTLLAKSIRQRYQTGMTNLILKSESWENEFIPLYREYFLVTQTSYIPPFIALLFYWLDRAYKQISFDPHLKDTWLAKNIYPVLEKIESVLNRMSETTT